MAIQMNGFTVTFNNSTFKAQTLDMQDPQNIREFRDRYQADWFTYWRDGILTGIARHAAPHTTFGSETSVRVEDALQLLANRLNEVLPSKFPTYEAFRRRPFSFLGRKDEIVGLIRGRVQGLPNGLSSFTIRPKFELDSRLIETTDGDTQIGLLAGTRSAPNAA